MALIIEDGTGKPDATSYVTVEEAKAYALARGAILPAADAQIEQLLIQGMDYLQQFTADNPLPGVRRFKGCVAHPSRQALLWPRTGVVIEHTHVPSTTIPSMLKHAQMQLAIDATSFDLLPSSAGYSVAVEQVDVIKVEYATGGRLSGATRDALPILPKVTALLGPLLVHTGSALRTLRI